MTDDTCAAPECTKPRKAKPPTGPQSPYCSVRCRARADYLRHRDERLAAGRAASAANRKPKPCGQCGAEFVPRTTNKQVFCSRKCGKAASNAAERASRPPCSAIGCDNKSISLGLCRQHHPAGASWSRGRPETRQASLRTRTQQRRARLRDPEAESIDRNDIGQRDGWACGLCAKKVNQTLPYPHPMSASLDHIVPLSVGGLHVAGNVQISHLKCNVAKGNRGGGEQLLLIG